MILQTALSLPKSLHKKKIVIVFLLFTTLKEEAANSAPNLAQVLISSHLKLYCLVLALVTIFTGDDINNTTLTPLLKPV